MRIIVIHIDVAYTVRQPKGAYMTQFEILQQQLFDIKQRLNTLQTKLNDVHPSRNIEAAFHQGYQAALTEFEAHYKSGFYPVRASHYVHDILESLRSKHESL